MSDWEKHVVPDWVVDDYNSRVPEEDRLPLRGSGMTDEDCRTDGSARTAASAGYSGAARRPKWEENTIDRQIDNFLARIMIAAVGLFLAVAIWASL